MSHFAVLVIGPDIHAQLAPYHEFESTGDDNQYVQDVDITDDIRNRIVQHAKEDDTLAEALDYHGLALVSNEDEIDTDGTHKYGYAIVKDGILIKAVNRTNPNAKWDWFSVGGRWTGFFKLKENAAGEVGEPGAFDNQIRNHRVDTLTK